MLVAVSENAKREYIMINGIKDKEDEREEDDSGIRVRRRREKLRN